MFDMIKYSALHFAVFVIFDIFWIGFLAKDFFKRNLSHLANINDGEMVINFPAAILAYVVMSFAVEFFVFKNQELTGILSAALIGALLGFSLFAVFDLTNRAILKDYSLQMVIVDISWGTFMTAMVCTINYKLRQYI